MNPIQNQAVRLVTLKQIHKSVLRELNKDIVIGIYCWQINVKADFRF